MFKEYYQYYLSLHQNKWNRRLHVVGQVATLLFVGFAVLSERWYLIFFAPFVVYPFAWLGHLFFEKNKPAAWSNLLWAKASDWIMFKDWIVGKVDR